MTMFSDYSLKFLIHEWREEILGPNPFIKVGETMRPIKLKFAPQALINSPSSQLQIVGELADTGSLEMSTIGGTIVYTVNASVDSNSSYTLEVLTVATSEKLFNDDLKL